MSAIICPYCDQNANLVGGDVIYPHRSDLHGLMFWHCAPCDAYVGCHKHGVTVHTNKRQIRSDGTLPLGRLANAQLRKAKSEAHSAFDPLWRFGNMTRRDAYAWLSKELGISSDKCHIGMMNVKDCNAVVLAVKGKTK